MERSVAEELGATGRSRARRHSARRARRKTIWPPRALLPPRLFCDATGRLANAAYQEEQVAVA